MLFNSFTFLAFFAAVYPVYLLLRRRHRLQNAWLLAASLVFYGFWDWRFLGLLAVSSGIDFATALRIDGATDARAKKRWLVLSLASNLTILGFFKYFGFFVDSLVSLAAALHVPLGRPALAVALPVGISVYTFQAMSYVVDVYRGDLKPCRSALDYALFIAFFPHLVAGPIQRPIALLPQVEKPRTLDMNQINAGIFLIVWGYLKKMVIADNMAPIANEVFDNYAAHGGLDVALGALAFTFQIYGDFSGYSDIARGLSKLLGFELLVNFKLPYFALNPTDFWLRWHVSLSTWLRDYLYIPLGGNRGSSLATYRNLLLTMLLGGLWHGAAYNFVLWGAYHGALLVLYRRFAPEPVHEDPWGGRYHYAGIALRMALMFALTVVGWVLFRASSMEQLAWLFSHVGLARSAHSAKWALSIALFVTPLLAVQLYQYKKGDLLAPLGMPAPARGLVYAAMLLAVAIFAPRISAEFIYFQF